MERGCQAQDSIMSRKVLMIMILVYVLFPFRLGMLPYIASM